MKVKRGVLWRYTIASIFLLWIGEALLFRTQCPWWYWFSIQMIGIMGVWVYSIAEKVSLWDIDFSIHKYPMANISIRVTIIAFPLAVWQLFDHMISL